jgi:hypothetical protein
MAHLRCDECGCSDTNAFGSWDTPIKILCKKCSDIQKENNSHEPQNQELNIGYVCDSLNNKK